jgi:hypothetical protein
MQNLQYRKKTTQKVNVHCHDTKERLGFGSKNSQINLELDRVGSNDIGNNRLGIMVGKSMELIKKS